MHRFRECYLIFVGMFAACSQDSRREQSDREAARLEAELVPATTIDTYLRQHVGFSSTGGQVRCSHLLLGADSARAVLYVWAYCREFSSTDPDAHVGSGLAWPLVLHLDRSSGATRIVSHEVPRDGNLSRADRERLFPAEVRPHPVFTGPSNVASAYRDSLQRAIASKESSPR